MVVEKARAKGSVLVLDAGNALFQDVMTQDDLSKKKAELVLKTMGELKTAAMAVGLKDLNLGPAFLKDTARKAGLKVLSANLFQGDKPVFEPSTVVSAGGARIGLIGLTAAAPQFAKYPGLVSQPPVAAAIAQAKKLKPTVDLVVVLAAVPIADALQLAKDGGADVDVILQSTDGRSPTVPQQNGSSFLITCGERGRMLAQVDLDLSGKGALQDLGMVDRDRQTIALLDQQMVEVKRRMESTTDAALKKSYETTLKNFEDRKKQLEAAAAASKKQAINRTIALSQVFLGPDVTDDPGLKAQVDKLQPPAPAEH